VGDQNVAQTRVDTALGYAQQRDWSVFPVAWPTSAGCSCKDPACPSVGKHPAGALAPHGLKDATKDEDTIRACWAAAPEANIGIACEPSGLVVLDVDPRHGGDRSLEQLEAVVGPLKTAVVHTGGGGRHFYFAADGTPISSRPLDTKLYPGIDVKACGGSVVAPGSMHASGQPYRWGASSAPKPIPPALLQILPKRDEPRPAPRAGDEARSGTIPEGARNDSLTHWAGKLRHAGLDPEELRRGAAGRQFAALYAAPTRA
jgi:hypothetical protein